MTAAPSAKRTGASHPGPPAAAAATAFVGLFVAGLVLGPALGVGNLPSPYASGADVVRFVAVHPAVVEAVSLLHLLAAFALVMLTAILQSRLQFLAPSAPGPTIAAVGGVVAAVLLAVSALLQAVLPRAVAADDGAGLHALHYLTFLVGGPAHTAALGILVLGAAVTSWFLRRLQRWFVVTGFLIALVAFASSLSVALPVAPLIPIGRFTALLWLAGLSVMLPRERATRRPKPPTARLGAAAAAETTGSGG